MPIETEWMIEDLVLGVKMIGQVTIQEYLQLDQEALQKLDQLPHEMHSFVNSTEMIEQPRLIDLVRGRAQKHANFGWLIEYGLQNHMSIMMGNIMARVTGIRYHHFQTREQAWDFLCSIVPELQGRLNDTERSNY